MNETRKVKRYLTVGALVGALLSISSSLLLDTLYKDSFQGTWRDAIAKDFKTFFSLNVSPSDFIVIIAYVIVLGILAAFGAFLGYIFSFFLYKFFHFLTEK